MSGNLPRHCQRKRYLCRETSCFVLHFICLTLLFFNSIVTWCFQSKVMQLKIREFFMHFSLNMVKQMHNVESLLKGKSLITIKKKGWLQKILALFVSSVYWSASWHSSWHTASSKMNDCVLRLSTAQVSAFSLSDSQGVSMHETTLMVIIQHGCPASTH